MRGSMASKKDAFKRAMATYLENCRRRGLSHDTVTTYAWTLRTVHRALIEGDLVRGPTTFGETQARAAYESLNHSPMAMRFLSIFLHAHGNDVLSEVGLIRPLPPPTVRWLDLETGEDLLVYDTAMQMGPPYSTMVHLELRLLFRRVSCRRARIGHFGPHQVIVHGKGTRGGKLYAVSPHRDTPRVLQQHENWRRAKVETARRFGWDEDEVPDYLFLANHWGDLGRYRSGVTFDGWLNEVERESGVRIGGHHTLRRTGGRKLWLAGVAVETVSEILGHATLDQTVKYLGIGISDMARAQEVLAKYEEEQRLEGVLWDRPSETSQ